MELLLGLRNAMTEIQGQMTDVATASVVVGLKMVGSVLVPQAYVQDYVETGVWILVKNVIMEI